MGLQVVYRGTHINIDCDGSVRGGSVGDTTYIDGVAIDGMWGLKYPSDVVPGFVSPDTRCLGHLGLIHDNRKNKTIAALCWDSAGGKYGSNYWNEVSVQAGWSLGYKPEEWHGETGPAGGVDFTIMVDTDYKPDLSSCNGDYYKIEPLLRELAVQRYGADYEIAEVNTAFGAAYTGDYTGSYGGLISKDQLNIDYLQHKVMVLNRNSPEVDFKAAKENNVSAVIVEAGFLYDKNGKEAANYKNPKVRQQCISANNNDIPFGLWCESRAKDETSALAEIAQLAYIIRNYPPVLGMWVHFNFTKNKTSNDKIIAVYQREMKRLGLLKRIGIIASKDELEKISWSEKHYKNWILWLVEHTDDASKVDDLLDPSMFTIGSSIQLDVSKAGVLLGSGDTANGTSSIIGDIGNLTLTSLGQSILDEARKHNGKPFVMGATGPYSFDCSGFTQYVYNKCGMYIPRVANDQYVASKKVKKPKVGDLIFFQKTYDTVGASHVGIVTGQETMIHAGSSTGIVERSFMIDYYTSHFLGFGSFMN